jgi:hypothetical protein
MLLCVGVNKQGSPYHRMWHDGAEITVAGFAVHLRFLHSRGRQQRFLLSGREFAAESMRIRRMAAP